MNVSSVDKMDLVLLAIYSYNIGNTKASEEDIVSLLAVFQSISNMRMFHFILQGDTVISLDVSMIINLLYKHGYIDIRGGLILTEKGYHLIQKIFKNASKLFYEMSYLTRFSNISLRWIASSIIRTKEKRLRELSEEEKLALNLLNAFKMRMF